MHTPSFAGFPQEAFTFFDAIARDTSWHEVNAQRELHARVVRAPMLELAAALEPEFGASYVYRLHRSPGLWTHQYAYVALADTIVLGLSLSLEGLTVEGGWLRSSRDQVERYRTAVAASRLGEELEAILDELRGRGYTLLGVRLSSRPRGVATDHPRIDLLRHRSLLAERNLGRGSWISGQAALERVRTEWRALRPLTDWFAQHVGRRERGRT